MDENIQNDPVVEQSDSTVEPVATQNDQTQTPSTDASSHGEDQSASTDLVESNPASSEDEPSIEVLKKEYGKLRQVQEEAKKYRENSENLLNFVASDEKTLRNYIRNQTGASEQEIDAYVGQLKQQNPNLWAGEQGVTAPTQAPAQTQPQVDPYVISNIVSQLPEVQYAKQMYASEVEKSNKFIMEFEKDKPDLSQGSEADIAAKKQLIGSTAQMYMKSKAMPKEEAYKLAYLATLHPEKLAEEGKMDGYLQGLNNLSQSDNGGGTAQRPKSSIRLTADQQQAASLAGMSAEDYAKYANEDKTVIT